MNPHQKNKIDINSLSPEEQKLFRLYGKIPSKSDHLAKHLKERKYFDSGDYALSKAGKADSVDTGSVGSAHPLPENIPHLSSPITGGAVVGSVNALSTSGGAMMPNGSPVKEASFLHRETSANDVDRDADAAGKPVSPPPAREGIPIRK